MKDTILHADVARQIAALTIRRGQPLIISDADEVLVDFMASFERHLNSRRLYFTWESYRLNGNIRRAADHVTLDASEIFRLLKDFFAEHIERLDPVAGAAEALAVLSRRTQVVVLSNVPLDQRERRQRWLARHGLDFPLVANVGAKGPAVRELAARAAAPTYFIDDSPHHHQTVARAAGHVCRLQFVADRRLACLLDPAPDSHHRADEWPALRALIETELDTAGY